MVCYSPGLQIDRLREVFQHWISNEVLMTIFKTCKEETWPLSNTLLLGPLIFRILPFVTQEPRELKGSQAWGAVPCEVGSHFFTHTIPFSLFEDSTVLLVRENNSGELKLNHVTVHHITFKHVWIFF